MQPHPGKRSRLSFGKTPPRRSVPISLVILALIGLFFFLIPVSGLDPQALIPHDPTLPTAGPTRTPVPRPTGLHGGRIVFTCTRGDYNFICLINADGSGFQQLTNDQRNSYYPIFTPEGGAIVFASNQRSSIFDLYQLVLGNSTFVRLTTDIGNAFSASFSPDGQQIAFVNRAGDVSPQPGGSQALTSIWVMGRGGEHPHQLYTGPDTIVAAKWSPLGDKIAFAMSIGETFAYQIYLLDLGRLDQPPRRISDALTAVGGNVDWSPDGKNLLIYAGPVGMREVYRLDVASGKPTQLTSGGNNAAASYSPDGRWIVYNSLRNKNQADLYVMDSDGHQTRQLTDFPEPDWQPAWEP